MKTIKQSLFTVVAAFAILGSFSCEREEEVRMDEESVVTDEEIVALVNNSLDLYAEGLVASAEDIAATAEAIDEKSLSGLSCGETRDTSGRREYESSYITAVYTNTLTAVLNCNDNGLPTSLIYQRSTDGAYETNRFSSNDGSTTDWLLTEILRGPNYVVNGTYQRLGTQTSKVREQRVLSTDITMAIEDLLINKGEQRIEGGSAEVSLTVSINDEERNTYALDLIFQGDGEATLIVNGNVYPISIP